MSLYEILGQLYQKKMQPKHIEEFDRFASEYERYKIIQRRVARYLVQKSRFEGKHILDLGAGSGEVYRAIGWDFERFYAVDLAQNMLRFHPRKRVQKIVCDFDSEACWQKLAALPIDHIFASSSLQWSRDLKKVMRQIRSITSRFDAAIFTSGTFETIHAILGISSPIQSKDEILPQICQYFMVDYEVKRYKLFFSDRRSMFSYIKRSGVSSGQKRADIGRLKELIRSYPYPYLEFEVVFVWSKE